MPAPNVTWADTHRWVVRAPAGLRIGDWEVTAPLANGAWSSVYEARAAADAAPDAVPVVAVKLIPAGHTTPGHVAVLRAMASGEQSFRTRLAHHRLVRTYGIAVLDGPEDADAAAAADDLRGTVAIVMERATGSLSTLMAEAPLSTAEAGRIIEEISEGLAYIHDNGWLHGDLKPANVLLGEGNSVLLADFGLSAELDGTHAYLPPQASPDYLAPELHTAALAAKGIRSRTSRDIWALGTMAHQILTGELPFAAGAPAERRELAIRHMRGDTSVLDLEQVPAPWRTFVAATLNADEKVRRTYTARTLYEQARRIRGAAPEVTRPRRARWVAAACAVALLAATGTGWWGTARGPDHPAGRPAAGAPQSPATGPPDPGRPPRDRIAPPLEGAPNGRWDGTAYYSDDPAARPTQWRPWDLPLASDSAANACLTDGGALYCPHITYVGGQPSADNGALVGRIEMADGTVRWRQNVHGDIVGILDGVLVVCDRFKDIPGAKSATFPGESGARDRTITIAAYGTADGQLRWATRVNADHLAEAAPPVLGDGMVFLPGASGVVALALADGRASGTWSHPFEPDPGVYVPQLRFADHRLYYAFPHSALPGTGGSTKLMVVDPARTGYLATAELPVEVVTGTGFAVRDGIVHCAVSGTAISASGVLTWDSRTGTVGSVPLPVGALTGFSLVGDAYVVGLDDNRIAAVRTDDHVVLWEHRLPGPRYPGPLQSTARRVYLFVQDAALALDLDTGHEVWRTPLALGVPSAAWQQVFATVSGGVLYARIPAGPDLIGPSVRAIAT